jgi:hypothetical protein
MANYLLTTANNEITAGTLNLGTGVFYAHAVESAPALSAQTVADLAISSAGGYAPVLLTGVVNDSASWRCNDIQFPLLSWATAPVGTVICKQAGASPASTDRAILYWSWQNSGGQDIPPQIGSYAPTFDQPGTGIVLIQYDSRYQYASGSYVANADGGFPKGLIWLIGSENNTAAGGYTNPDGVKITSYSGANLFDRSTALVTSAIAHVVDFSPLSSNKTEIIKIGKVGMLGGTVTLNDIQISVAQSLPSISVGAFQDDNNWTTIGSGTSAGAVWSLIDCSANGQRWRFLRIKRASNGSFQFRELELYESTIYWPNVNIT